MTTHDFAERLAWSHAQSDRPWWAQVYAEAFPGMVSMETVTDHAQQLAGIDRIVTLDNGRTITVDEKVRAEAWPDVLLERWSVVNGNGRKPGWMQDPTKRCEYLAYAFEPTGVCHLLPYLTLRRAWLQHGKSWIDRYPKVEARNDGYLTICTAVPTGVLLAAITDAMTVTFLVAS